MQDQAMQGAIDYLEQKRAEIDGVLTALRKFAGNGNGAPPAEPAPKPAPKPERKARKPRAAKAAKQPPAPKKRTAAPPAKPVAARASGGGSSRRYHARARLRRAQEGS